MSKRNANTDIVVVTDATRRGLGERADFVGRRQEDGVDGLVFRCSCGCGGHVVVDRVKMEKVEAYRRAFKARCESRGVSPGFGGAVYVKGHEPMGILAETVRTGERTQLRATA
jgi:hypothetical protein